jgi:cytochrome b subunit of formate dehydrogenase
MKVCSVHTYVTYLSKGTLTNESSGKMEKRRRKRKATKREERERILQTIQSHITGNIPSIPHSMYSPHNMNFQANGLGA